MSAKVEGWSCTYKGHPEKFIRRANPSIAFLIYSQLLGLVGEDLKEENLTMKPKLTVISADEDGENIIFSGPAEEGAGEELESVAEAEELPQETDEEPNNGE